MPRRRPCGAPSVLEADQLEADHGRWSLPVIPTTMPKMPHNWYVTAHKIGSASD
jgi:hypothetical protein